MNPVEWLDSGELDTTRIKNEGDIYTQASALLDAANSTDILGRVLFKADDGKYYCVTVEAMLYEANPLWVKDVLEERIANGKKENVS